MFTIRVKLSQVFPRRLRTIVLNLRKNKLVYVNSFFIIKQSKLFTRINTVKFVKLTTMNFAENLFKFIISALYF